MYVSPCFSVCAPHLCRCTERSEEGIKSPGNGGIGYCYPVWMPVTETGSSATAASVLNC